MTSFKNYPQVSLQALDDESSAMRIITSKADALVIDVNCDTASLERFVECWNALRHVAFPAAHVNALEERVQRLEQLRKDAWARAEALQAECDAMKARAVQ